MWNLHAVKWQFLPLSHRNNKAVHFLVKTRCSFTPVESSFAAWIMCCLWWKIVSLLSIGIKKKVFLNSNNRHIILVSSAISLTISEFKVPEIAHYGKRVILKVKTFFIILFWNLNWFNQNRQQKTFNLTYALFPSSGSNSENMLSLFFWSILSEIDVDYLFDGQVDLNIKPPKPSHDLLS